MKLENSIDGKKQISKDFADEIFDTLNEARSNLLSGAYALAKSRFYDRAKVNVEEATKIECMINKFRLVK